MARKELINQLRSFRFWVGALLAILLAASSTLVAAHDYELRLHAYAKRQAAQQLTLRRVSVYSALQPLAARPPELLSILNQGPDIRLGTEVAINLFTVPFAATGEEQGNDFLILLPVMDLTHVVSLVLGLLALLLTCDSLTSEREDGTLPAVLADAVVGRTVLAGKLAGNLMAILLPLAGTLLVSLAILHRTVAWAPWAASWWRIVGLVACYVAYLMLMLLLGLWMSARAGSTARALSLSVVVWFVLTILVPAGAWAVADNLPGSGRASRETEQRIAELTAAFDQRLDSEFQRSPMRASPSGYSARFFAGGPGRAVLYREGAGPYYDALAGYYRFVTAAGVRLSDQVYDLERRYDQRLESAERRAALRASLSPTTLLYRLADSLSDTATAEHDRFMEACRIYRRTLLAYMEAKGAFGSWRWFTDDPPGQLHPWPAYFGLTPEQVGPGQMGLFSRLAEPALEAEAVRYRARVEADPSRRLPLGDLPGFSYRPSGLLAGLRRVAPEGAVLLLELTVAWSIVARTPIDRLE